MSVVIRGGVSGTSADVSANNELKVYGGAANNITGGGPSSVNAAITDTLLLAANTARRFFKVYNDSTAALYLSYGTNAASTTAYSVKVNAGGYLEETEFSGMVRGIWTAATGAARITEGTP